MSNSENKSIINQLFEKANDTNFNDLKDIELAAINSTINLLSKGDLRVCTREDNNQWLTHQWLKQAILLYFRTQKMQPIHSGDLQFFDKIPLKKWGPKDKVRVVPHALVRMGAYVAPECILMPSYTNIGAYIDSGTMIDTWATVGSCAQIGKNVHVSGGVGIGGVLEPIQANPVIIEDHVFIGSRSIIVEGAHIGEGAVIGAGVTITATTKIFDVSNKNTVEHKAHVPARSVVIPGVRDKKFPGGNYGVPCALIIGKRTESTDNKTSLTQALRDFDVTV